MMAVAAELLRAERTALAPAEFVARCGEIFTRFDATTQDSGNVSFGVRDGERRFFVKTAGSPVAEAFLPHDRRVALLRNAARLARSILDPALPPLLHVVESVEGPLLVYAWVDGELLRADGARSSDGSAHARFRSLPQPEALAALDAVFRLHVRLAMQGWIASDFYDGCLIYDFEQRCIHVIDLDSYRDAPFTNEMGRMFGSTRFMAPEEHQLGARIDERTTVFALGRAIQQLVPGAPESIASVAERACALERRLRYGGVAEFYAAWSSAAP